MKKLMIITAMLVGACGHTPDAGFDILLVCNGQQILVSPGKVRVTEAGSIEVTDVKADATTFLPAGLGCIVTKAPLGSVSTQPTPVEKTDV